MKNQGSSKEKYHALSQEWGISLLEILVVLLIVSILSSLSLSRFQHNVAQRQLVHHVREIIAFLSYQRQHAILFNDTVKITLQTSPQNRLTATSLLTYKTVHFQLMPELQLKQTTVSYFTFSGLRQTLKPLSFVITNVEGEVKIIISALGRIRACSQQIKAFPSC